MQLLFLFTSALAVFGVPATTLGQANSQTPVGGPALDPSQFHFRVAGAPGERQIVEASTNLRNWTALFTNAVSTMGYYDYADPQTVNFPHRFYRAQRLPGGPVILGGVDSQNNRILVKPLAGLNLSALHVLLGTTVLNTFPAIGNLQIVQLPIGASLDNILALFRRSGLVQYAEPDFQVQALVAPDDFRYNDGSLWGLHNTGIYGGTPGADIHAQDAWDAQNSAANIIVAVIDTGVRYTHEDLAGNMWVNPGEISGNGTDDDGDGYVDDVHGINAINNTGDPMDDHGHGTHVSGTIGGVGNNSIGVVGVAWKVQIMACKFLDSTGNGFLSDAIKCMDYARAKGARVVNASWGSTTFNSTALRDAIDSLRQAGIIFVAAAGNSSEDNGVDPIYPASYDLDNIISVAATTRTDELANFSNYGATTVDLGAPGAAVFSCWNGSDSDYRYFDGTSMAAPHVTGSCALLAAHFPNDNYQQIINRIVSNVDPLPTLAGKCVSGGRLNLQKALGGSSAPLPPTANFSANPSSGNAPLTVQFTDSSSGSITAWDWDFGDGTSHDSAQNPTHTYNNVGDYTVMLTVTGSGGSDSKSVTIHVTSAAPGAPTANFSANPTSGNAPLTVQFTDQSSGSITAWDWDFGDASPHSSAQNPSYTYNGEGEFTVTLTVTGSGGSDSKSVTIRVTSIAPPPPTANFNASPASGNAPLTVQFTDQSSGSITTWDWNFGDGSPHSNAQNPSHTYNNAGDYTVTLTVTGSGGSNSKSLTIHVTVPSPKADFTANPTSGSVPLTVQFTDKSTGTITAWDWNFGDGLFHSSARNPSHLYVLPGDYTVTLTVTGSDGTTSRKSLTIHATLSLPLYLRPQ